MHESTHTARFTLITGLMGIFLILSSCSPNENYNRGYVISQSQIDTAPETSQANEQAAFNEDSD